MTSKPTNLGRVWYGLGLSDSLNFTDAIYDGPLTFERVTTWVTSALALADDHDSMPDMAEFTLAARERRHGFDYNDGLITDDDHAALFACFVAGDAALWVNS